MTDWLEGYKMAPQDLSECDMTYADSGRLRPALMQRGLSAAPAHFSTLPSRASSGDRGGIPLVSFPLASFEKYVAERGERNLCYRAGR